MASIYELEKSRRNYYNLKDKVETIISYLNESINSISDASDNFKKFYTIDFSSADAKKINNSKEKMIENRDNLKNKIIPSINSKIYSINREIENEESKLT